MKNLLKETKLAIENLGHTESDIIFIGAKSGTHQCTWEEFCTLADVNYDSGCGAALVAYDLIIVFRDGQTMWRGEYDGSEWWGYSTPFKQPETSLPIRSLLATPAQIGWVSVEECNREEGAER